MYDFEMNASWYDINNIWENEWDLTQSLKISFSRKKYQNLVKNILIIFIMNVRHFNTSFFIPETIELQCKIYKIYYTFIGDSISRL